MGFEKIIPVARCRKGGGTFVEFNGYELAVFLLEDPPGVFVIDNACPHAGGNLSGGDLSGKVVSCRLHQWSFDLTTGSSTHSPTVGVRCYRAEARDGMVWIDLASGGPRRGSGECDVKSG